VAVTSAETSTACFKTLDKGHLTQRNASKGLYASKGLCLR